MKEVEGNAVRKMNIVNLVLCLHNSTFSSENKM